MVLTIYIIKMLKKIFFVDQCTRKSACFDIQLIYTVILLSLCCYVCDAGTENLTNSHLTPMSSTSTSNSTAQFHGPPAGGSQGAGTRTILRIYDECSRFENDFVPCLKKKAIFFLDRLSHIDAITVADGIKLVRSSGAPTSSLNSVHNADNELESSLSSSSSSSARSKEDRDTKLTNMLIDRLSQFLSGHTLHVSFPKLTSEEIGRSLDEGRGKMKKMMGMMVMGMAMKMMGMIPVAMGMLYMMAGKALIVSKIALLLAGIMGIKKLMSGRGGSSSSGGYASGGSGGWSSGGGGGGGGWDRRSLPEAQELAYGSYKQYQHQQQYQTQQQQTQQHKSLPLNQQQQKEQQIPKIKKS